MCYNEKEKNNCDSGKDIIDCGNAELIREEKQMNEIDWKDLELDNVNELVENDVLVQEFCRSEQKYKATQLSKGSIIKTLIDYDYAFRYRLKPLESIRITEDIALDLCTYISPAKNKSADFYHTEDLENHYGRKVEIIE